MFERIKAAINICRVNASLQRGKRIALKEHDIEHYAIAQTALDLQNWVWKGIISNTEQAAAFNRDCARMRSV